MAVSVVLLLVVTLLVVVMVRGGKWPMSAAVTCTMWGVLIGTLPVAGSLPGMLTQAFGALAGFFTALVGLG